MTTVTDETSRAELEEAMHHLVNTVRRMPSHWVDRRAEYHHRIDALLDKWQAAR